MKYLVCYMKKDSIVKEKVFSRINDIKRLCNNIKIEKIAIYEIRESFRINDSRRYYRFVDTWYNKNIDDFTPKTLKSFIVKYIENL